MKGNYSVNTDLYLNCEHVAICNLHTEVQMHPDLVRLTVFHTAEYYTVASVNSVHSHIRQLCN